MSHADKANSTTSPLSGQVQNPDFASFRDNRDGWDNQGWRTFQDGARDGRPLLEQLRHF